VGLHRLPQRGAMFVRVELLDAAEAPGKGHRPRPLGWGCIDDRSDRLIGGLSGAGHGHIGIISRAASTVPRGFDLPGVMSLNSWRNQSDMSGAVADVSCHRRL